MKILRNIKPGYYELPFKLVNEYCKIANRKLYAYARMLYVPYGDKYQFQRVDISENFLGVNISKEGLRYSERDLGEQTDFDSMNEYEFDVLKIPRTDKDLIKAAEVFNLDNLEIKNCKLEIVEIPDDVDWEIKEISVNPHYLGGKNNIERIIEKHREW